MSNEIAVLSMSHFSGHPPDVPAAGGAGGRGGGCLDGPHDQLQVEEGHNLSGQRPQWQQCVRGRRLPRTTEEHSSNTTTTSLSYSVTRLFL